MAINLYTISVPVFIKYFNSFSKILKEAENYAKSKGIPESDFIDFRLAPDMLPLSFQVHFATKVALYVLQHVGGYEEVTFQDDEKTLAELQSRISLTIKKLEEAKESDFVDKEEIEFDLVVGKSKLNFKGLDFVLHFAIPNFYFHYTTAYDMFRHLGVEIGKRNFLGMV